MYYLCKNKRTNRLSILDENQVVKYKHCINVILSSNTKTNIFVHCISNNINL